VIPDLIEQYVDTGKIRYVYREFPLLSIHPGAQKASEAAICAGEQGKYWEMSDHLFANQSEWPEASDPGTQFSAYASELGLDTSAFEECMASGEAAAVVQWDLLTGESLGVNATPYFFVNDMPIRGGLPIEALGQVIDYAAAGGPMPEIVPTSPDWHMRGNPQTARAITVAFVDYASPESAEHATEVLPRLVEEYVDTGQMVYVLQPWAGAEGSPGALAAVAAECAGQQDKGWEMHAQIFADQKSWTSAADPGSSFADLAENLDLDADSFKACLESEEAVLRARAGTVVGALYGVPGAPVFLFNNGQGQQGSPSYVEFKGVIDSILGP
jgi:protein-disulfide isomerase